MINHNLLNQYDINVENVKKYYDTSKQVKKFVDAITDENELRYKKMIKIPKLKALLKNLEDWYCNCCNTQLNNITAYNKHLNSPQHKAKETGEKMVICSNPKCRKKMMESELENHYKLNTECVKVSPTNLHNMEMINMKKYVKRAKELYSKDKNSEWSKEDKQDYNDMMIKDYRDSNNILIYDNNGFLIVKMDKQEVKEIKKDTSLQEQKEYEEYQQKLRDKENEKLIEQAELEQIQKAELWYKQTQDKVKEIEKKVEATINQEVEIKEI